MTAEHIPAPARPLARAITRALRRWDTGASDRVTAYIANSQLTRQRIADSYGRAATVVHPPVEVYRFGRIPGDERSLANLAAALRAAADAYIRLAGAAILSIRPAYREARHAVVRREEAVRRELARAGTA